MRAILVIGTALGRHPVSRPVFVVASAGAGPARTVRSLRRATGAHPVDPRDPGGALRQGRGNRLVSTGHSATQRRVVAAAALPRYRARPLRPPAAGSAPDLADRTAYKPACPARRIQAGARRCRGHPLATTLTGLQVTPDRSHLRFTHRSRHFTGVVSPLISKRITKSTTCPLSTLSVNTLALELFEKLPFL